MASFFSSNIQCLGANIQPQAPIVINNVFKFLTEVKENPEILKQLNFNQPRDLTGKICGVSVRTVDNIRKECMTGDPKSPREHVNQPCTVTALDDFDKSVIKQIVSSFYTDGKYPIVQTILEKAKERIDGFRCSVTSMRTILKTLGYKYKTTADGRKTLMERKDVVCARLKFLKRLKELKDSGDARPRIYLDETWLNQNHCRKRAWLDENDEGGLCKNIGKGSRLIVCHAGCAKYGFLPDAKWVFKAVKSSNEDYHIEMNAEGFQEWFHRLLLSLEEPSVIIMDNASYHSKQINRAPTSNSRVEEIREWLRDNNIPFSNADFKAELLLKVHRHKPEKTYFVDQLANECGHEVIRLPAYHCQYNPIELIWAQVKGEVATKNNTFRIADVQKLLDEAIENVTKHDWEKCVRHAEALQEEDLRKARLHPDIIINVGDDESDDDWSDEDYF